MARDFSKNTSNYATLPAGGLGTLINGAAKVLVVAWGQPDTKDVSANNNRVLTIAINGSSGGVVLGLNSDHTVYATCRSQSADSAQSRSSTATVANGAVACFGAAIDYAGDTITPYVGGVASNGGAVTFGASVYTQGTATALDFVGAGGTTTPISTSAQFDGRLERIQVWRGTADAADPASMMADLATGDYEAGGVSASGWELVAYLKLTDGRPELETLAVGGLDITYTGTVALSANLIAPVPTGDTLIASDDFTGSAGTIVGRSAGDGVSWEVLHTSGSATGLALNGSGGVRIVATGAGTAIATLDGLNLSRAAWIEVVAKCESTAGGDVRLYSRMADGSTTGLIGRTIAASAQASLRSVSAGVETALTTVSSTSTGGSTYTFRFVSLGRGLAFYVDGKLVTSTTLNVRDFIASNGKVGFGINNTIAGTPTASDGWTVLSFRAYRPAPTSAVIAVSQQGGNAGDPYAGYHLVAPVATRDYIFVAAEGRVGPDDDDPKDLVGWQIPKADLLDDSYVAKCEAGDYPLITIRGDGTSASRLNHNPLSICHDDGTTLTMLQFYYPSSAAINTPVAGTSGDTAQCFRIRSTDQGATWGSPVNITTAVKDAGAYRFTIGPGTPIKASNNRYYIPFSENITDSTTATREPGVLGSDDLDDWSQIGKLPGSLQGSVEQSITQRWGGDLRLDIRDYTGGTSHWIATSADGGETWTDDGRETEIRQSTASPHTDGHFHATVRGRAASDLLALHANSGSRERLTVRVSGDDGHTWDPPSLPAARVLEGGLLDDSITSYANACWIDDDHLFVVWIGGEQSSGVGITYPWQEFVKVGIVPRAWLGLTAASGGRGRRRFNASLRALLIQRANAGGRR